MELRGTILQPWNWNSPALDEDGHRLWKQLKRDAQTIRKQGFSAVWLPPCSQASFGAEDVGYAIKNWYELDGTKYGDKSELQEACLELKTNGIQVYHDQVHNHLMGGELEKDIWCLSVKKDNRAEPVNSDCIWFQTDLNSAFPKLGLNRHHFDAYHPNDHECWILKGKSFEKEAYTDAWGGCDLDFDNIEVTKKLEHFGLWFQKEIHTDGYRFDAVKHIRPKGTVNFLTAMRTNASRNMFAVAEFLHDDINVLHHYIAQTYGQVSVFDVPLQRKFVKASMEGSNFDMGSIFNYTLTQDRPTLAVPFVHSHDDMPPMHNEYGRGHYVGDWFISQAYALILLRREGYPMVSNVDTIRHKEMIRRYMLLRGDCTYGHLTQRFDHRNTVGWSFSRSGSYDNSMAVLMSNGDHGTKWLPTFTPNTVYLDFTGTLDFSVTTNNDGWAEFHCPAGSTSIWIEESKYNYLLQKLHEIDD